MWCWDCLEEKNTRIIANAVKKEVSKKTTKRKTSKKKTEEVVILNKIMNKTVEKRTGIVRF